MMEPLNVRTPSALSYESVQESDVGGESEEDGTHSLQHPLMFSHFSPHKGQYTIPKVAQPSSRGALWECPNCLVTGLTGDKCPCCSYPRPVPISGPTPNTTSAFGSFSESGGFTPGSFLPSLAPSMISESTPVSTGGVRVQWDLSSLSQATVPPGSGGFKLNLPTLSSGEQQLSTMQAGGQQQSPHGDKDNPEKEADIHFEPIVRLPEQFEVKKGEEDDKVLFAQRAKLYRFDNKEWKERGVGELKMLQNPKSGKVRLLMRRDQVLKVCCNHFLSADMTLSPMANSDRSWVWFTSCDVSEATPKPENFAAKFKTKDIAEEFKAAFEGNKRPVEVAKTLNGSWTCDVCFDTNPMTADECLHCHNSRATVSTPSTSTAATPTPTSATPTSTSVRIGTGELAMLKAEGELSSGNPLVDCETNASDTQYSKSTESPPPGPYGKLLTMLTTSNDPGSGTDGFPWMRSQPQSEIKFETKMEFKPELGFKPGMKFGTEGLQSSLHPVSGDQIEGDNPEKEADIHFEPIVRLPEQFEVKKGEEDDKVLFAQRAKLYRFDNKEWKERGVGELKMLQNPKSGKVRLLMRRDQVLKVCCNHFLSADMTLSPMANSDRSWVWFTSCDVSEVTPKPENFAAKFKTKDIAEEFREAFERAQHLLRAPPGVVSGPPGLDSDSEVSALSQLIPALETDRSDTQNTSDVERPTTPAGQEDGEESLVTQDPSKDLPLMYVPPLRPHKMPPKTAVQFPIPECGEWICVQCGNGNKASNMWCVRCQAPLDRHKVTWKGSEMVTPDSTGGERSKLPPKKWTLGDSKFKYFSKVANKEEEEVKVPPKVEETYLNLKNQGAVMQSVEQAKWVCPSCSSENSDMVSVCVSCGRGKPHKEQQSEVVTRPLGPQDTPSEDWSDEVEIVKVEEATPEEVRKAREFMLPDHFYLYKTRPACPGCRGCDDDLSGPDRLHPREKRKLSKAKPTTSVSASSSRPFIKMAAHFVSSPFSGGFQQPFPGSTEKGVGLGFGWMSQGGAKGFDTGSRLFGSDNKTSSVDEPESEDNPEKEANIHFEPIVRLPEQFEVKKGEEDDKVLFAQRAKLYRFDNKEWKERGVGELKMLQNPKSGKVRLLMRRDQVLKVCCNHFLSADMTLSPMANSDRSWVWFTSCDVSEATPKPEKFAAKFKTKDIAEEFREAFEGNKANKTLEEVPATPLARETDPLPLPSKNTWECPECLVTELTGDRCPCCNTVRTGSDAVSESNVDSTSDTNLSTSGMKVGTGTDPQLSFLGGFKIEPSALSKFQTGTKDGGLESTPVSAGGMRVQRDLSSLSQASVPPGSGGFKLNLPTLSSGEQQPSTMQSEEQQPSTMQSEEQQPSTMQSEEQQLSTMQSGEQQLSTMQSGEQQLSTMQSGEQQPSTVQSEEQGSADEELCREQNQETVEKVIKMNIENSSDTKEVEEPSEEDNVRELPEEDKVEEPFKEEGVEGLPKEDKVEEPFKEEGVEGLPKKDKVEESFKEEGVEGLPKEDKVEESSEEDKVKKTCKEDKVKEPSEEDEVKEPSEEDKVKEPSEEDEVKEPSEVDKVKEPSENKVEEPSEEDEVKEPSEEDKVKEPSENKVEEPSEEDEVKEPSEEDEVKEPSEEDKVKEPSEEDEVKEPSEEDEVKEPSEEDKVKEPSEEDEVKEPSEEDEVKEPSEEDEVKEPSEEDEVKEPSEEDEVKEPSEEDEVKEPSENKVEEPSEENEVKEPSENKVEEPSEEDKVKEPSEEDEVKEPSEEDEVKEPSEVDKVKEPSENKVKEPSEEDEVKEPSEEDKVKEPSENKVEEPSEEDEVKEPSEEDEVKEPSEEDKVKEPSEEDEVKEPSEEDEVKEPSEDKVKEPSEEDKVKEPSEEDEVKEPSEEDEVKEPSEEDEVKEPSENKVEEPSEEDEVKEPSENKVEEPSEEDKVKEPSEEDEVKEPSEEDEVKEPSEVDKVKEPSENKVKEPSEEDEVKEPSEEDKVKEPSENKVEEPSEEDEVKEPSEEDEVKEPSEEDEVKEPSEEDKVKEPSEEDKVKEPSENKVEEPSEEDEVKEPSEEDEVKEPSEEDEVKEPSEDKVKEPSEEDEVKEPSEGGEVKEPSEGGEVKEPSKEDKVEEPSEEDKVEEPLEESIDDPSGKSSGASQDEVEESTEVGMSRDIEEPIQEDVQEH